MNRFLLCAAVVFSVASSSAMADTRSDFMSNPDAYGVVSVNKGLPNGRVVAYDIPIHASLLGRQAVVPVVSYGRPLASPIAYGQPMAGVSSPLVLGMAHSPYARN
jgi:hypothetical protein